MVEPKKLLRNILNSTPRELVKQIYRDELTGVYNRRAFYESTFNCVAIADLDSLKYLNDTFGHRVGDRAICELAHSMVSAFGDEQVFRLSGDEFGITGEEHNQLREKLAMVRQSFPGFSFGIGCDLDIADNELRKDKLIREENGERSPRGVRPPWAETSET